MPTPEPWTILDEETLLDAAPWLRVDRQRVRLPDGRTIDDYYQIAIPPFTLVFAETDAGEVLVLRQYRHGPRRVTLALPGGRLEEGETPFVGAQRELLEETGYAADAWTALGTFTCNANQGSGTAHAFRAAGARRVAEPRSGDLEDDELLLLSRDRVRAAVHSGEVALLHHAGVMALALLGVDP